MSDAGCPLLWQGQDGQGVKIIYIFKRSIEISSQLAGFNVIYKFQTEIFIYLKSYMLYCIITLCQKEWDLIANLQQHFSVLTEFRGDEGSLQLACNGIQVL